MWRLWNKLFGWDYIIWENSCNAEIERIRISGDGKPYFLYYGKYPKALSDKRIKVVCWLTCPPEKYETAKG